MQTHLKSVRPIKFGHIHVYVKLPPDSDKMAAMGKDLLNLNKSIVNVASSLGYSKE